MTGKHRPVARHLVGGASAGVRHRLARVPSPRSPEGGRRVDRSWAIAHVHGSGRVYPNFPDFALNDWAAAYHGYNLGRLRAAKPTYDPDRLFHFPPAI